MKEQVSIPQISKAHKSTELHVKLPFTPTNRQFLYQTLEHGLKRKSALRRDIRWTGEYWTFPASKTTKLVDALVGKWGACWFIKENKHSDVVLCAAACQTANPDSDCVCSCSGRYHGGGGNIIKDGGDWVVILESESSTFTRHFIDPDGWHNY